MSAHPSDMTAAEACAAIRERIVAALPGAEVQVQGEGGHFVIEVESTEFEGLGTLQKQQKVYAAIKDLMAGDFAPVHAVDRMVTRVPGS